MVRLNPLVLPDWDAQVAALPGAGFFHSSAWARVLHATYGYQPLYLAETDSARLQSPASAHGSGQLADRPARNIAAIRRRGGTLVFHG